MSEARGLALPVGGGRLIGLAEYGDPAGVPTLYFHGVLGSRFEALLLDAPARELGLRIVAVERPGYGLSSPAPADGLARWGADVAALADALGLRRLALLGVSAGGPYALAAAATLGERVRAVTLVGSLGPVERDQSWLPLARGFFALARSAPLLLPLAAGVLVPWIRRDPLGFFAWFVRGVPQIDRSALAGAGARQVFARSLPEGVRQGTPGVVRDLKLMVRPWDIDLSLIRAPVQLWHGAADRTVPPAIAQTLARALPTVEAHLLPDEGHFSLPIARCAQILRALIRVLSSQPEA